MQKKTPKNSEHGKCKINFVNHTKWAFIYFGHYDLSPALPLRTNGAFSLHYCENSKEVSMSVTSNIVFL